MPKSDTEMLNSVYREISEHCGFETAVEIYHLFRGQQISFPVRIFDKETVHARIVKEYDGTNIRKLAEKYKYSEKTVRRIVNGAKEKMAHTVSDGDQNEEP